MMVQCSLFCVFFYQLLEKKKTTTTIKQIITKGAALQTSEKKQTKQNKWAIK